MRASWGGGEHGTLLPLAKQAGFKVFVTLDNMRAEQNMEGRRISILILKPAKPGKEAMKAMTGRVLIALATLEAEEVNTNSPDN